MLAAGKGRESIQRKILLSIPDLKVLANRDSRRENRGRGLPRAWNLSVSWWYPGYRHLIDIEMLDENCPNNAQRIRRRAFYLRNGYRPTGQLLSYFGGDFEMLVKGGEFRLDDYKRLIASLDIPEFQPVYFTKDNRV